MQAISFSATVSWNDLEVNNQQRIDSFCLSNRFIDKQRLFPRARSQYASSGLHQNEFTVDFLRELVLIGINLWAIKLSQVNYVLISYIYRFENKEIFKHPISPLSKLESNTENSAISSYSVFHILPQIYTANHATLPKQITVQICSNF